MQNDMSITAVWSKSQPKEKFQYGGRLQKLQKGNITQQHIDI